MCEQVNAYDIRNCDSVAESDIEVAADFLEENMSELVDSYTFLTERQRQEVVRKWVRIKLRCSGKELKCDKFVGHAHGGPGNRVNICYYSFVSSRDRCDLVGTIMHEQGHAHGFRMVPGHNNPTDYHYDHDPIYRMGAMAEEFCRNEASAGKFNNIALQGTGNRAIGTPCTTDLQCDSSRCVNNVCVCNEDSDCPTGQKCFKPATARNYCSSVSLTVGGPCTRNDQCRSNKCEDDVCVCRHDSDCPSGQICRTPITRPNFCEASQTVGASPLGSACNNNAECLSNKCEGRMCVCNSDSDCPAGEECYRPITAQNICRPVFLPLGAACARNSQCSSNKCERDRCVCRTNDDCPAGQVCKTPITGANRCES